MGLRLPQTVPRVVGALLFIIGGGVLTLLSVLGAPSLWYQLCFITLPIIGIVWLWRPVLAAPLSIGPLIAVAALLQYAHGMWLFSRMYTACVIAGLAAAVVL